MMEFSKSLRTTASTQHGALSRSQLAAEGVTTREVSRWVRRGWLIAFGTNVFRVAGSPVNDDLRIRAALLDVGRGAMVSHTTAADLHWFGAGLPSGEPIHITIPRGQHLVRPNVRIHEARDLVAQDTVKVRGVPVTSGARTLIDLARCASRDQLVRHVDAACAKGRTTPRAIHARVEALRRPGREGLHRLVDVLSDRPEGGIASVLEREFFDVVKASALPLPQTQVVFAADGVTIARVDALFPNGLIVELMSKTWHTSPSAVKADSIRRRRLRLAGHHVIEFWADEVFSNPDFVVAELRRHLALPGLTTGVADTA